MIAPRRVLPACLRYSEIHFRISKFQDISIFENSFTWNASLINLIIRDSCRDLSDFRSFARVAEISHIKPESPPNKSRLELDLGLHIEELFSPPEMTTNLRATPIGN